MSRPEESPLRRGGLAQRFHPAAGLLVVALLLAYAATWFGATSWVLGGVAAVSTATWLARRRGVWLGAMAGLCAVLLVVLDVVVTAPYLGGLPFRHLVNAALLGLGLLAAAGLTRTPAPRARGSTGRLWPVAGTLTGAVAWSGLAAYGMLAHFDFVDYWVVHGDGRFNFPFALELIDRNGIGVAPGEYAVPLPTAIIGLEIAARRAGPGVEWTERLDHEAFMQAWALTVPLSSVLAGLAAMVLIPAIRTRLRLAFGAVGSLLPVSPLVFGVAYDYGFFNVSLVVTLMLASWVIYARRAASPPLALATLIAAAALMLEVWSPLVVVPASFGIALVWCERAGIRTWSRRAWLLVGLAAAQFLVLAVVLVVPALTLHGEALSNDGGMAGVRPGPTALLAVVPAVLVWLNPDRGLRVGVMAVLAGLMAGLGALLWLNRELPDPWIYYPQKYAWFGTVLLLTISLALLGSFWARASRSNASKRPGRGSRRRRPRPVADPSAGDGAWDERSGIPRNRGKL